MNERETIETEIRLIELIGEKVRQDLRIHDQLKVIEIATQINLAIAIKNKKP